MSKYSLEKKLPSCSVERQLLKDLDNYIIKIAKSLCPGLTNTRDKYKFIIIDSFGEETLGNIDDFKLSYFPNDTKKVKLTFFSLYTRLFDIGIIFDLSGWESEIRIELEDESPREKVNGIYAEVITILRDYKTKNFIFHLYNKNAFVSGLFSGLAMLSIFLFGAGIREILKGQIKTGVFFILIFFFVPFYIISSKLKPYSTFQTRLNINLAIWYRWFCLSFLGFWIFGVLGVFFRKKIFGF